MLHLIRNENLLSLLSLTKMLTLWKRITHWLLYSFLILLCFCNHYTLQESCKLISCTLNALVLLCPNYQLCFLVISVSWNSKIMFRSKGVAMFHHDNWPIATGFAQFLNCCNFVKIVLSFSSAYLLAGHF